ncbi:sulfur carrier protein ThiS [Paenibacillus shirakamiensis]|nr:sulfur carrier protein ThiS [Paenibacillus shirakamiensis]
MRLTINGQMMSLEPSPQTVADVILRLDLSVKTVVVERNQTILTREMHVHTPVHEGDILEIVHFVGGG